METGGAYFGSPDPQDHFPVKGQEDTRDRAGCHVYGTAAVLHSVCQRIQDGKLASCENYWYGNIRQHKGKYGGGISHGIRSVEDYNAVVIPVFFINGLCQFLPVFRLDIGAVQLEKFQIIYLVEAGDIRYISQDILTGQAGYKSFFVLDTCQSPSCGNDQYFFLHEMPRYFLF